MRSIKTSSLVRRALAVSLGLAFAASAVYASDPGPAFSDGQTLNAARMNQLNSAVSDNNTRIGTLQTDVTALKNGVPTCGTGTTAVGPACVDNTRQGPNVTWSAAVDTCRAAGKRLLTPGEYMAAKNLGTITDMTNLEFVDAMFTNGVDADPRAGRLQVGYMGPSTGAPDFVTPAGDIFVGLNADYDAQYNFIYYRCAR
jgi:hypothetical protein